MNAKISVHISVNQLEQQPAILAYREDYIALI